MNSFCNLRLQHSEIPVGKCGRLLDHCKRAHQFRIFRHRNAGDRKVLDRTHRLDFIETVDRQLPLTHHVLFEPELCFVQIWGVHFDHLILRR